MTLDFNRLFQFCKGLDFDELHCYMDLGVVSSPVMTFQIAVQNSASIVSINDIRDRYYRGERLRREELLALFNYETYRLSSLNQEADERKFHEKYLELQVMANLSPYEEFLKEEYNTVR